MDAGQVGQIYQDTLLDIGFEVLLMVSGNYWSGISNMGGDMRTFQRSTAALCVQCK